MIIFIKVMAPEEFSCTLGQIFGNCVLDDDEAIVKKLLLLLCRQCWLQFISPVENQIISQLSSVKQQTLQILLTKSAENAQRFFLVDS